ncbi:glycerol-3-phosphate dehydrogenase/oxidase [Halobacillus karajensis]|uniref:Glycerol-3-phosphate dehydrogenase n=1 Tax=Halobacillus karajensis TaxID=195088 RepID=A0A059NWF8_9BACI|nr:FAD-dependent oxidoreductase [Halobacillus karajensis]CDQ19248.1 Aerobic glycerol-3-phosphate dehydrogenase [Halobacillus karajensis]CDQ22678.1 Aerobic glycerol-3-phosphate dehydrogenase [Halobacillus karajensis]CDQ26160.1 Aerobic glycerol-3-phosphate dehydrogenase [Halobacillus karajensis]
MLSFSSYERENQFNRLAQEEWDVLVIGGGITGSGIALDAASRGMKTAVVEMQDYAAGTSSRSTKLVHGGLRYLKQFEVKMVAEVGKEREIVYENGPHVTTPEWMLLPFHEGGNFGPFSTNIGLRVYDYLAGVKKSERRTMMSAEEALKREPLIKKEGLKGAGYYVEYKTDDARLTLEVMKKAVEYGACSANYAKVVDFIYDENGSIVGAKVEDTITGEQYHVKAKKIINAGGPWVDELREIDGSKKGKTLHLTKGVHLVFDQSVFPLKQAIYFDSPDGRMIFAIPRGGKTYVGTTDTTYDQEIAHPTMTKEDRDYILDAMKTMFPSVDVTPDDVESSWAGLRPLIHEEGKDPSEISRKDEIFVSDSGLISMAGGKLTGYRKMAQTAVNLVRDQLMEEFGIRYSDSETKKMPISGGDVGGSKGFKKFKEERLQIGESLGLSEEEADKLIQLYGSNVDTVFNHYKDRKEEAGEEGIDPVVFAQLTYALEEEMTYKPVDFFVRRTAALFFNIQWVREHKTTVIEYMAKTLNYNEQQKQEYTEQLNQLLEEAVTPIEYV